MNSTQLNAAAKLLGINDKNAVLAICTKVLIDSGMTVDAAINAVCGNGTYENMINTLYTNLRAA